MSRLTDALLRGDITFDDVKLVSGAGIGAERLARHRADVEGREAMELWRTTYRRVDQARDLIRQGKDDQAWKHLRPVLRDLGRLKRPRVASLLKRALRYKNVPALDEALRRLGDSGMSARRKERMRRQ